ncbi:magnesium transporter Alr1p [Trichomonascus vanleenenianus]|uniref:magnesium transporter CorA family protein n=1 Tax=Trichomonascus vanleenenianus TaxID=2268995 RepID=UPI003ECB438E
MRSSFSELRPTRSRDTLTSSHSSSETPDDVLANPTEEPISQFGIDPMFTRPRGFSQGSRRRDSTSSCAVSERSVASGNVEGILLNKKPSTRKNSRRPSSVGEGANMSRRSRRLTKSSVVSAAEDASRLSFGEDQKEEDVCFPLVESNFRTGIDFDELDDFFEELPLDSDSTRHCYKQVQARLNAGHRPLAPPGLGTHSTDRLEGTNFKAWNYDDEEKSIGLEDSASFDDLTEERFSFFASEWDETVHAPDLATLCKNGGSARKMFDEANGTWWLDCLEPTDAEMKAIAKAFGIHPLTTEDIKMQEAREKVELFKTYYFVCFHTFDCDKDSPTFLDSINMHFVVFKNGILSFHFRPVQHTANVRRRIRQLQDYVNVSSDWICYALIDDITDSFAPIIKDIEIETDIIEDSVFVARECDFGRMLRRIGMARKKVMSLMRLLFGKADVIKMFAKRCNERWDNAPRGEIGLYLGDIQDHIVTMYQNLSVYEKIFSRSHGNYLAQLQVESVNSSNRVTKVLGRVTVIGTLLVPLNLVTGLFGMNVHVPGEGGSNLGWFFGIIGFMILAIVVLSLIAGHFLAVDEEEEAPMDSSRGAATIRSSAASVVSKGGSRLARFFNK